MQEFQDSQIDAEVSALRYLHYPIRWWRTQVVDGSPADKVIKPGDQMLTVNGKRSASVEDVFRRGRSTPSPGQTVPVVVQTGSVRCGT